MVESTVGTCETCRYENDAPLDIRCVKENRIHNYKESEGTIIECNFWKHKIKIEKC